MTRAFSSIVLVALAVAAVACNSSNGSSPSAPTTSAVVSLSLSSAAASGSTIQVTAIGRMADGSSQDVTHASQWESSNTQLAVVSQSGVVTAVGKGDVDVRASYMGISGSIRLSVAPPAVTSLSIAGVQPTGSFQLTATAKRADGTSTDVTSSATWQSSDTRIAGVSGVGYVTVLADGDVDLSATFEGATATVHATVSLAKIYSITGTVTDAATLKPIANARVQVIGGGHAVTDAAGQYRISGVTEGRTLVEFDADGYGVEEKDVTVDGDVTLSVALSAEPS